ncbi:MAG: hypothetical protein ACI92S_004256, partial [Planctomycetaceae bacterium]
MLCNGCDLDLANSVRSGSKEKRFRLVKLAISGGVGATVNTGIRA